MLAKRIIPCLDVKNSRVVKGTKFKNLKDAGNPVKLAKFYYEQGADELVLLDITATLESRKTMLNVVEKVAEQIFIPLTVGGGIRNIKDIADVLHAGADKVAINTAAVKNPQLIAKAAEKFGSQCVVIAVDAIKIQNLKFNPASLQGQNHNSNMPHRQSAEEAELKTDRTDEKFQQFWEVVIKAGNVRTGLDAIDWIKKAEGLGAGETLLTSIDRDGTCAGYDLELLRVASNAVRIPVIASGGAGSQKDILDALTIGQADAALLAGMLHFGGCKINELKKYLRTNGATIRL